MEFRQGLRHLLNLLKQSLIRKNLTTITHRHTFTILTRNLGKSIGRRPYASWLLVLRYGINTVRLKGNAEGLWQRHLILRGVWMDRGRQAGLENTSSYIRTVLRRARAAAGPEPHRGPLAAC